MAFISHFTHSVIWGTPMVVCMLLVGILLTLSTRGILFRKSGIVARYTLCTLFQKQPTARGAVSPFAAVCTALAGTVGTGNIVGVALAIAVGGAGAVFWMWVSALAGMIIKYAEVTLAVFFRTRHENGSMVGGPMYYIRDGLHLPWLAGIFAVCGALAAFGIGAAVQANSLVGGITAVYPLSPALLGAVTALLAALVLIGGIRRISNMAQLLVPFMALLYLGGCILVLFVHRAALPAAFVSIFKDAFCGTAAVGGFAGSTVAHTCRVGIARGVFTHEAGMGSAPIAHAAADTDHPAKQGLWGTFEVFFDSIVMCTVTALVILSSGVWTLPVPQGEMSALAFKTAFAGGDILVAVALALFAFATVIAWYYYGEQCVHYLFPRRPAVWCIYQIVYVLLVYVGAVAKLETVWTFADLFNGMMAIPNLLALVLLSPQVRRLTDDFFGGTVKK